jgi:CRP/FNR family transcriptional regulator, cyclic AMP receptor protein
MDRIRLLLANSTFLGGLPSDVLDGLVAKGQVRSVAKGAAVYRRGDPGNSLMVVIDGRVKLTNTSLGGTDVVLYYAGAGELLGEVAALDGQERAADAIVLEDSDIFVICTRELLPVLTAHPTTLWTIIRALCARLRMGAEIIEDNTLEMRGRMARGLLRLARQQAKGAEGTGAPLTIPQEELGKYLGMSRANVSRQLGQLKTAKVITASGTEIAITDEQGLMEIAQASPMKD